MVEHLHTLLMKCDDLKRAIYQHIHWVKDTRTRAVQSEANADVSISLPLTHSVLSFSSSPPVPRTGKQSKQTFQALQVIERDSHRQYYVGQHSVSTREDSVWDLFTATPVDIFSRTPPCEVYLLPGYRRCFKVKVCRWTAVILFYLTYNHDSTLRRPINIFPPHFT